MLRKISALLGITALVAFVGASVALPVVMHGGTRHFVASLAGGSQEFAGLIPSRYAAPFAQVTGASSDLDTTATAYTSCTTEGNPCTWAEVNAEAACGDIIGVLPGDIVTQDNAGNRFQSAIQAAATGCTSGTKITFVTKYSGAYLTTPKTNPNRTTVCNGVTSWTGWTGAANDAPDNGSPSIGANNRDYIRLIGFVIDGETCLHFPDTGPVVLASCTGCEVHQFYIDPYDIPITDNNNGLRLQDCLNCKAWNNKIEDTRRQSPAVDNYNASAIMTYGSRGFEFKHNYLINAAGGFYIKGESGTPGIWNSGTMQYNKIENVGKGAALAEVHTAETLTFTQNVICNYVTYGIEAPSGVGDPAQNINHHITNNSIGFPHSTAEHDGIYFGGGATLGGGHVVDDNVINVTTNGNSEAINASDFSGASSQFTSIDGNIYYASGGTVRFALNGVGGRTLAQWETDMSSTNGSVADPGYTDEANCDFTRALDGKGAYLTGNEEIGLQASPVLP
jgi:hypothetical protein